MITFLIGIGILILGYFTWGKIAEKIFGPDNRLPPVALSAGAVICGRRLSGKEEFSPKYPAKYLEE